MLVVVIADMTVAGCEKRTAGESEWEADGSKWGPGDGNRRRKAAAGQPGTQPAAGGAKQTTHAPAMARPLWEWRRHSRRQATGTRHRCPVLRMMSDFDARQTVVSATRAGHPQPDAAGGGNTSPSRKRVKAEST